MFKAYHVGYIVNEHRIMREISLEYGLLINEIKIIAYLYELISVSTSHNRKTRFPSYTELNKSIDFLDRGTRSRLIRSLCDRGFIKWFNKPGAKDHNTFKAARFYDIGREGVKVLQSYSGKMARYYKANYYTKQVDREHERIRLMIEQEEMDANPPHNTPPSDKDLTKEDNSSNIEDISKLFSDGLT